MPNAIQDPLDRLSTIIEGEKSPFVELSERMKTTSKDVQNLNLSILDLAIALEKRAGISKEKEKDKEDKKIEQVRTLSSDTKDFFEGFKDYFKENLNYAISSKSSIPADIEKIKPEISVPDQVSTNEDTLKRENNLSDDDTMAKGSSEDQSKVLSDMVEVLIDMRDDKSQKQLVDEAVAIKKLIIDQNKKTELPGGIEPNNEQEKDLEREKLSELIARKLGDVMQELGIGSNSGLNLGDLPNGKRNPSTKTPSKIGPFASFGGKLLGGAGLAIGAYEASEYLKDTGYSDKMKEGAGLKAEKAFRENVTPMIDPNKAGVSKDEALAALENGSPRDIEKLGGVDALRSIAGLPPLENKTEETKPVFEQASLRKYDYNPQTSPKVEPIKVEPKPTETSVGKILNEVSDKNTELKMFNMNTSEAGTTLAPIISNKTINNTEQTLIANSPSPHSNSNSFNRWQRQRSNYTDSLQ